GGFVARARGLFAAKKRAKRELAPPVELSAESDEALDGATFDGDAFGGGGDHLFALLVTQEADGRFRRSAALDAWLSPEARERLAAAAAKHGEDLVVTAIVVALLARDAADRVDEWRPAVDKARRWLASQGASFDAAAVLG
ncbi:MAG: hypothetical protein KC635_25030, partial [Myxococcales bacterium]|nr:hypothetical protein [Myxococcales bacterium]